MSLQRTGLTSTESAHWHQHGWVAIPDFFDSREIALLQGEILALQAGGKLRNVSTTGDGKTVSTAAANLQLCPVGPHSRPIRALAYAGKVSRAIESLIGSSAVQHLDQVFLKPARHGAGTNWHTDNAYFQSDLVEAGTGMWIAVQAANRANGSMRIIPGSHRQTWAHRRDLGSDHHITCADAVDVDQAIDIILPAGGVLFFNYGIAHATGGNGTDADRAGLALHFVQEGHAPAGDHFFLTDGNRASRRIVKGGDGGVAVYGEDLRGVWESLSVTTSAAA
jgi:phytanoyl-CoA hydroxylase